MDIVKRNVFIYMERNTLDGITRFPLPPGYSVKWYASGDEKTWVDIHQKAEKFAEVSRAVHTREFGSDVRLLGQRQCFLLDEHGAAVATATAWFDDNYHGERYGRVHWVAVVPEFQGRELSKPLLSIVLFRMAELGHDRAYLRTSTARLPAVNLYAHFGFEPSLRRPEDASLWRELEPRLR